MLTDHISFVIHLLKKVMVNSTLEMTLRALINAYCKDPHMKRYLPVYTSQEMTKIIKKKEKEKEK